MKDTWNKFSEIMNRPMSREQFSSLMAFITYILACFLLGLALRSTDWRMWAILVLMIATRLFELDSFFEWHKRQVDDIFKKITDIIEAMPTKKKP